MANKDVDTRIVEMQFDGKDFDKNIRSSQKTLEDFKKSLNFEDAAKQMKSVTDSEGSFGKSISDMAKNVAKLAKEFTGIGSISTFVAQKIKSAWQGAANSVERFMKSMTSDQIKEGSKKYEGLLKSVQTIKNATGDSEDYVYGVMEKLNKYTDETSYDFADMANNIGKFTTAGVALEDAEKEMEGIANWAAFAGQGVTEAQRAMYNISQAMSAGSMRLVDYKSIQNANMDIRKFRQEALDAAVAAGTLKKSKDGIYKTTKGGKTVNLDNFTETLQYKWFDKKTMENVFKTFADNTKGIGLEAYKAAQRCTTLSDVIKAWKDMLSTGWMKSYEHVFGKLSDAMGLFSGLCNKVSEDLSKLVETRNNLLERWSLGGGRNALWGALFGELETPDGETLFKGAYGLLDAMREIGDAIREAFWDFVGEFIRPENKELFEQDKEGYGTAYLAAGLQKLTEQFQKFTKGIKDFLYTAGEGETETRMDRIKHLAQAVFAVIKLVVDIVRGAFGFVKTVLAQLAPSFKAIEQLIDFLLQLFTGAVVSGAKKNTIGNFFAKLAEILKPVTTVINILVRVLANLIARVVLMVKQSGLISTLGSALKFVTNVMAMAIVKFLNSQTMKSISTWIQNAISRIPALVEKIKGLGKAVAEYFQKAKNKKGNGVLDTIRNIFGGKKFGDILKNLKTNIKSLIKKIPEVFPALNKGLAGIFTNFIQSLFGIGTASAEGSEEITDTVVAAVAQPIEALGKENVIGKAIDKAKPGFLENLKTKISEIWHSIADFFTNLGNSEGFKKIKTFFAGTNFMELLKGAKDIMKWLAIFRTGSGLVSIGKGTKALGKGIKVFGKNLKNLNLTNIFKDMFNISNVINSNNTDNSRRTSFENLGNSILKIAASIGIIVLAASKLAAMKPDELKQAGISLGVIITALVAAGWAAKKFTGNGGSLMALAAGVLILLIPMRILHKMTWGPIIDGVSKLAVMIAALAFAGKIAGNVKMKGFVGFALAVNFLLIPLKVLAKMPLLGDDGKFGGLVQGMLALIVLMMAMGGAARLSGGKKMKGMLSLAIALNLLLIPVKALAGMKLEQAAQGVVALIFIIAAITTMVAVTNDKAAAKLAGIVGAMTLLTTIGFIIGKAMDWKQALVGFGPIIAMLVSMTVLLHIASKVTPAKLKAVTSIFVALTVLVVAIVAAISAMSILKVSWELPTIFMAGLVLVIGAIGFAIKQADKVTPQKLKTMVALFGVFAGVVIAVAGAIVAMSIFDVDWKLPTIFMLGLVAVLSAIGSVVKKTAQATPAKLKGMIPLFAIISGLVLAVAGGLVLMSKMNVDWTLVAAFTAGLSVLIAAIGWALPKLGNLTPKAAIIGVASLAAAIIAIMGAIGLMIPYVLGQIGNAMQTMAARLKTISGLLQDFFDRMSSIDNGAVDHALGVFDKLKDLVLKFAGFEVLIPSMQAFSTCMNYIGTGLDLFFLNDRKYPDPEQSKGFKVLNKLFEIQPALSAFSVGTLPKELLYLGVGLMLFEESTKDIATSDPVSLKLLQGIFGQADNIEKFAKLPLDTFRSQMAGLGGAMSLYAKGAKEVTGLAEDGSEIPDISSSIAILKAVCAAISGEDGSGEFTIPDNMPSSEKLGLFAGDLEALGTALSTFATAAHSMETNTTKATALLKFLAEIGGYVTPENLKVVDAFDGVGHVDESGQGGKLGQFALDIGALGTALSSFASNIAGSKTQFDEGLEVLQKFEDLNAFLIQDNLQFTKAFDNADVHATALGTFSTDIGALGRALASFAQNIKMEDGTKADFDHALTALNFMATLQNRLPKIGGLHELIYGTNESLGKLADDVQIMGQALSDFSTAITGEANGGSFDLTAVNGALDSLAKMVQIIGVLNTKVVGTDDKWADDYGDVISNFTGLLSYMNQEMSPLLANQTGMEGTLFQNLAKFAKGISDAFTEIGGIDSQAVAQFSDIATGLTSLITLDPSGSFKYPGEMISKGIEIGILNGESGVVQAAIDVVTAAIVAANETADAHSPSRVFAELGEFMDLGLAKGMKDNQDNVEGASQEMTQAAIDKATALMAIISQAMAESLDLQPTITPVLDLSRLTESGAALDALFNGYALNLSTALNNATAATSNTGPTEVIVQNPTDLTGLYNSISGLQTEIGQLQTAMQNMKIVLNTGVIAGGVTDDIDLNLGRKNLYASRRN